MNVATIYTLCDPRDGEVRYVGVTSKPLSVRLRRHLADAKRSVNHRTNWIRALLSAGVRPEIRATETVSGDGYEREREVIAEYRDSGYDLVNATDGGEGTRGHITSSETRAILSDNSRRMWANPEHRASAIPNMRAAMTPERNAKVRAAHTGRKRSTEQRERMSQSVVEWWKTQDEGVRRQRATAAAAARTSETWEKISRAMSQRRGWKHSPETKAKIAASSRARWQERHNVPQAGEQT